MTRDELRVWLDRAPPTWLRVDERWEPWRGWYSWQLVDVDQDDCPVYVSSAYLGVRSARTGPDAVDAAQKCTCPQCRPESATMNGGNGT